ncbi:fibrobacter succinogenes major paralogous domain-containing protein [uncultured Fibrobacter sp.]|uniref:fibrobacter succinogenes major paralogous domain-containing protein n=1 Tax=uncultured Fibrobacter sp. TaxID=261512 RepID=UPI002804D4B8|nr:fibrobacter succinogenes major paralogous domain-containing protein [uncultured Fibrobacter sp.]
MENRILLFVTLAAAFVFAGNVQKGSFTDPRDGKTYKTVKIGNQVWMAENLNYETDSSYCYKDKKFFCLKFGRLYTWNAAMEACPAGWHLPSDSEWKTLFEAVGGEDVTGMKLKSKSVWYDEGYGADDSGFSVLPAGYRSDGGYYYRAGEVAYFWSSTERCSDFAYSCNYACLWLFDYDFEGVTSGYYVKDFGFSVRCLRDSE